MGFAEGFSIGCERKKARILQYSWLEQHGRWNYIYKDVDDRGVGLWEDQELCFDL